MRGCGVEIDLVMGHLGCEETFVPPVVVVRRGLAFSWPCGNDSRVPW